MIKLIKRAFCKDWYLGDVHVLMTMDDTVLLSTSREGVMRKFKKCQQFCQEYGMHINEKKTKFMVINHDEAVICNNATVRYCKSYTYLGATITDDGSYRTMLEINSKEQMKQLVKFYSFLNRNPEVPFSIKKKVAEACVFLLHIVRIRDMVDRK